MSKLLPVENIVVVIADDDILDSISSLNRTGDQSVINLNRIDRSLLLSPSMKGLIWSVISLNSLCHF
jgi:hypothetical protein